ncbi:aminopeptidase [Candidatus Bathyarchaeota archaeon]|nr:aminopeptidase [Candidatus Bathyarchaeota archaeon]
MEAWKAAKNALECVLEAKKGETVAIFCDDVKMEVGSAFSNGALKLGLQTKLVPLKTSPDVFRKEIPQQIMELMSKQASDIYINLFRGSREETPFRIKLIHMETEKHKARLGHCPGVTLDMLTDGALALENNEHRQMQDFAKRLMQKLSQAAKVKITNPSGTNIVLHVEGRPFFTDTQIDWEHMKWMNLPTGEVIVAPLEDSLEGTLVCDMAIGGIGPLKHPVKLTVRNGKVQDSFSEDSDVLKRMRNSLDTDDWSNVAGEFAFGINSKARFVEEFLEAEKMLGTIHIAFGNNSDMPDGKNQSKNHMDFLVSKPTVKVYNKNHSEMDILVEGVFQPLEPSILNA